MRTWRRTVSPRRQYSQNEAWTIIVGTFESIPTTGEEDAPTSFVGAPTFTETLLRSILDLEPEQQFELVQALAHPDKDKRITKGKFKTLAESYRARNEMKGIRKKK